MNIQSFSSADFDKTPPNLKATLPSKLIHQQVEKTDHNQHFSDERKHPVHIIDLPSNTISMTIGGLLPSGSSNKHRHTYETILYILEGQGYSIIEGNKINWRAGDAVYVPNWAWHQHVNVDTKHAARYLACENTPMLQTLGQLAIREED